ncbi:MAG: M16 family metallopeptidase [Gammaproteobacteria bacterium]
MSKLFELTIASLAFTAITPTHAAAETREFSLENGLKVIVQEDHRAPVVVSQVWYKVGSSYEHGGITGISHALEHMMFQGTARHGPGEFSRIISEHGGEENAFTGIDYTAYFQKLDRAHLAVSFELEADRMRGLTLSDQEFGKEIKVVMEERRLRTDDNPEALVVETARALSFQTSPYRQPIIGWMNDIEQLSAADLRAWYRRWYAPNNAVVVVVGDIVTDEVGALAKKYFGPVPKSPVLPVKSRTEVVQKGLRRVTVRQPAKVPYLFMGYKVPVLRTAIGGSKHVSREEVYALEVLAGVLGGGDSARLNRRLVRERQIAAAANAQYSLTDRLDSLFVLEATPAEGRTVQELETALREEIALLKTRPIDAAELRRIKTQVIANDVYERDSMFYQAMQIGLMETVGLDWRLKDQYVDNIKAVTAEEVQSAARKYFVDDGLTVAIMQPVSSISLPETAEGAS